MQRGSVAIEFSLCFIILLALFYGIAGYAMPLLLSASYQQVASDALREGVTAYHRHPIHSTCTTETTIEAKRLCTSRKHVTDFIEENASSDVEACNGSTYLNTQLHDEWHICIKLPMKSVFPQVSLMGWNFPPLPDHIVGSATIFPR